MSPEQQLVLFENTARAMAGVAAALGINEKKNC
jgi:hypothetical protein